MTTSLKHEAVDLLRGLGAEGMAHPGGTLLAHLDRVHDRLRGWGARPELCLAGLCHAAYGTDGFAQALLPLERRGELAAVVGAEAERLVYQYASCDRDATYPVLADEGSSVRDRFTGGTYVPTGQDRADFAELTAANELDLADHDLAFRARWGAGLHRLFDGFGALLSPAAQEDYRRLLGPGAS